MKGFEKEIEIRWPDCDPNRHVRHSAYYDFGAHVRIRYFAEVGLGADKMYALHLGPVLFKEECTFLKELTLEDTIRINILKGSLSLDCSRWVLHHEIFNADNEKCAHITVTGAWMDLNKRKLTTPPVVMMKALEDLPEGEVFVYLKKS